MYSLTLQRDLDGIDAVSSSWNLKLNSNPEKCVVMRFDRDLSDDDAVNQYFLRGVPLKYVRSHRDLGVTVDTSLRFHNHIKLTAQKAGGLSNNLLRSTVCRSHEFMVSLLVAHVRPLIDYAS